MDAYDKMADLTGQAVHNRGIWKKFLHLIRLAKVPWFGIVIYLVVSVGSIYLAVMVPQVNGDFFAGDASVSVVLTVIGYEMLSTVLVYMMLLAYGVIGGRIDRNFRNAIWNKFLHMEPRYYEGVSPEMLLSRITNDAEVMKTVIISLIIPELTGIGTTVATVVAMSSINIKLAYIMAVFIPIVLVTGFFIGRIRMKIGNAVKFQMANLTTYLSEQLSRITVIKAFNRQDYETARGEKAIDEYYDASVKSAIAQFLQYIVNIVINIGPDAGMILIGIGLLKSKTLTVAGWVAFYSYGLNLVQFFMDKSTTWVSIKEAQGQMNRLSEFFSAEDGVRAYVQEDIGTGDIVFENVSFAYDEHIVVKKASFVIPQNSFTVLAGVSGSGKTTLLKLLERIYEPKEGAITVGGQDIGLVKLDNWRSKLSYIEQDAPALSGSIRDNILYGVKREVTDDEIMEAARMVHADGFIWEKPEGLDYEVGQFGDRLSGGQRQKLAIIRTILQKKEYVLMDEPTASLDVLSSRDVEASIQALSQYCTVLVATHDPLLIADADVVISFEDGTVTAADKKGGLQDVVVESGYEQGKGFGHGKPEENISETDVGIQPCESNVKLNEALPQNGKGGCAYEG